MNQTKHDWEKTRKSHPSLLTRTGMHLGSTLAGASGFLLKHCASTVAVAAVAYTGGFLASQTGGPSVVSSSINAAGSYVKFMVGLGVGAGLMGAMCAGEALNSTLS